MKADTGSCTFLTLGTTCDLFISRKRNAAAPYFSKALIHASPNSPGPFSSDSPLPTHTICFPYKHRHLQTLPPNTILQPFQCHPGCWQRSREPFPSQVCPMIVLPQPSPAPLRVATLQCGPSLYHPASLHPPAFPTSSRPTSSCFLVPSYNFIYQKKGGGQKRKKNKQTVS